MARHIRSLFSEQFDIDHTTLQMECAQRDTNDVFGHSRMVSGAVFGGLDRISAFKSQECDKSLTFSSPFL